MYRCKECGKTFDEPDSYEENMGEYWGAPAYDTFYICPFCGDENIEFVKYQDLEEQEV